MKQSVNTIVDSIEKKINIMMSDHTYYEYYREEDFEFGTFTYELNYTKVPNPIIDPWDNLEEEITIEIKSVTVTNEDSKPLTNLSTEVFNQLETTYTNY